MSIATTPRRFPRWLWILSIIAVLTVALLWRPVSQALSVAAVQDAVMRGWEMSFVHDTGLSEEDPQWLPHFADEAAEFLFDHMFESTAGYSSGYAPDYNRQIIHHERFRALFRKPIRGVAIYYCEGFRGDLGAALRRFPGLESVTINDHDYPNTTQEEWKLLCSHLRQIPTLEHLEIAGYEITDAAIAPLTGHPKLEALIIGGGKITTEAIPAFQSLPHLKHLTLGVDVIATGEVAYTPEQENAIRAALPGVAVKFDP